MRDEIELIRSGTLSGRAALELLEKTGRYVFHGSPKVLEVFDPRQATQFNKDTGRNIPDGEPAVFAANKYQPAVFKALINSEISPRKNLLSGWRGTEDRLHFYSVEEGVTGAKEEGVKAYVYVFRKDLFEPYREMEYRSLIAVKPEITVEVRGHDLPDNIEIIEPPEIFDQE